MTVGVGGEEAQPMCAALSRNLQCVVAGDLTGFKITDLAKGRVGTSYCNCGCSIRSQLVRIDVPKIIQVSAFGSHVGELKDG